MIDVKKALKHLGRLKTSEERSNFETLWQSGAEFCNPTNSDIQTVSAKGQRRRITRITDVGIEAKRGFQTGMYAWNIGEGDFFKYSPPDYKMLDDDEVSRWFSDVNRITKLELSKSNFDTEILQSFGELSYIGTTSTFSEWYNGALNFKTQHISQFWIDVDARGQVNTVFVEIPLNATQIIGEFGEQKVPDAVIKAKNQNDGKEFKVVQYCIENPNAQPDSMLQHKKPFISVYILTGAGEEKILRIDGYNTFPFSTSRLYKAKNEMYGRSCYMDAAQTISLHNDERYTLIRGAKNRADPPWIESADSNVRHIRSNSISRVIYDPSAMGGPPQQMDIKSDVGITMEMLENDKQFVDRAFYLDSFNPILDNRNMTAYETRQRMSMGLAKISPSLRKWQTEYATPMFERIFDILASKGKFPPMPESLEGVPLKVDYVSKAALALQEIEMLGVMSAYEQSSMIAQFQPEVMDNWNVDEIARMSKEVNNVPNEIIRSERDVMAIRQERAQQMQQQQAIENAPALADAAHKASQIEE